MNQLLVSQKYLTQLLMNQSDGALCERKLKKLEKEKLVTDSIVKQMMKRMKNNNKKKIQNEIFYNAISGTNNDLNAISGTNNGLEMFPEYLRKRVAAKMLQTGRPSDHFSRRTGKLKQSKKK